MDKVKLGRALGYGARHAVKTLAQAADAVSSSPPASPKADSAISSPVTTVRDTVRAFNSAKGDAKRSMFAPVRRFSGVLWLEVTGTFFALIALFVGQGVWRLRGDALGLPSSPTAQKFYLHAALFALFAYFAVSSFVRARRRERR